MKELNDKDKWLLSAVKDCPENSVQDALRNEANIDVISKEGTPLHIAVKAKKRSIIKILLQNARPPSINLVNREFLTPIEVAANNGDYETLLDLLAARQVFNERDFDNYVQYCVDHYVDQAGQSYEAQNHALIAHYVSRLVGRNVGELLEIPGNLERYVVHMYAFKTTYKGKIKLEGWKAEEFLPLRIYSFFEILIKLKKGVIKPLINSREELSKTEQQLKTEILLAREVLRVTQDRLAIRKFNEVISPDVPEDADNANIDLSLSSSLGSETSDSNGEEEIDPAIQIENLYNQLVKSVLSRVASLKESQSYPLSIGFSDHEIYLNFIRHQEHILIRIDN